MPELGQSLHLRDISATSAFPPIATKSQARRIADTGRLDPEQPMSPLDPSEHWRPEAGSSTAASMDFAGILTNAICWTLESH